MEILRTVQMETSFIDVGDQIKVHIVGVGRFTATAQQTTDRGTLFFMDDCIDERPMNENSTNEGGYEASDLRKWLNTVLIKRFPENLKERMVTFENGDVLSIPTYGQVFGFDTDDEWDKENIDIDHVAQLPLMKQRKNRVCDCDGDWRWYWLLNPLKQESSATSFAVVSYNGVANGSDASDSIGVRLSFLIA